MPGITDPTEAYFKDGTWGWDGTQWRKSSLIWGYSDRYVEKVQEQNVSAGNINVDLSAVPDGEAWVIRDVCMIGEQANYSYVFLSLRMGGVTYYLTGQANPGAWKSAEFHGNVVLKKDDYLRATFNDALDNDDFIVTASGYKMKIAE